MMCYFGLCGLSILLNHQNHCERTNFLQITTFFRIFTDSLITKTIYIDICDRLKFYYKIINILGITLCVSTTELLWNYMSIKTTDFVKRASSLTKIPIKCTEGTFLRTSVPTPRGYRWYNNDPGTCPVLRKSDGGSTSRPVSERGPTTTDYTPIPQAETPVRHVVTYKCLVGVTPYTTSANPLVSDRSDSHRPWDTDSRETPRPPSTLVKGVSSRRTYGKI